MKSKYRKLMFALFLAVGFAGVTTAQFDDIYFDPENADEAYAAVELEKYYDILELPKDASLAEISRSYKDLKELYTKQSIATVALDNELFRRENVAILADLENAYKELKKYFHIIKIENEEKIKDIIAKVGSFDGHVLQHIRETLNIDLLDISISSNIQVKHLENIEKQNFAELPREIYLRSYLKSYANFMALDPDKVLDDYMREYEKWRKTSSRQTL